MEQMPSLNPYYNYPSPKWYKKKWGITIIVIIIIIIALFVALIILPNIDTIKTPVPNTNSLDQDIASNLKTKTPQRQLAEKLDRPSFGNESSPLIIVEFSDFQCPVCREEFPIIREITNQYKNDILYIYRQYPVIDENSLIISQASLCAHEQGKFWAMHDKLFLSVGDITSINGLTTIARQSGLNVGTFNICMSEKRQKNTVLEDAQDGFALGVVGTPTFFINGNKLAGAITKEQWEIIINQSLEILK